MDECVQSITPSASGTYRKQMVCKRWRNVWKHCSFCFISISEQYRRRTFLWWSTFPRCVFIICIIFLTSLNMNNPAWTCTALPSLLRAASVWSARKKKTPMCLYCWIKINFALIPSEAAARPFFFLLFFKARPIVPPNGSATKAARVLSAESTRERVSSVITAARVVRRAARSFHGKRKKILLARERERDKE